MREMRLELESMSLTVDQAVSRLEKFKIDYGVFEIEDASKVEVQQRPKTGSRSWEWDVYLPGGPGHVLQFGYGDILPYGSFPNGRGKPKLEGTPDADDLDNRTGLMLPAGAGSQGELYRVSARLEKTDAKGQYSFSVSAARIGDDGQTTSGTISSAIFVSKEELKWFLGPSSFSSISTGSTEKFSADAGSDFVLFWVRDNSGPPAKGAAPAKGLIVWVDSPAAAGAKVKK